MWKHILAVAHRLGFTRNETLVLVFLVAVIAVGSLMSELRSEGSQGGKDVRMALRQADSAFARRSRAEIVHDEEDEPAAVPVAPRQEPTEKRVHLNSATERELITLPGIGPVTAKKILAYRQEHGAFGSVEDLVKVKSIGPKKLERIRQFITVE